MIISIPFFALEFFMFSDGEYEYGLKTWIIKPELDGGWSSRYRVGRTFIYNRFELSVFWGRTKRS